MTAGYFDLQVNGYAGVDFNQDGLTAEALHAACVALRGDGVDGILATIITEHVGTMCGRLRRLVELREQDKLVQDVVHGFHIEGPFISGADGYRGAHPADAVRPAEPDAMQKLLDAANGMTKLVTLAPECDAGLAVTRLLADRGVVVSAGHTDASLAQLEAAIDAGLSMFTHLGNGSPMQMHRHDNVIQRALSLGDRLWLCFIADGVHVPFFTLQNYLALAGIERCVVVTDAIAPAGLGPGRYTLGRWKLDIGDDLVARAADGSHLVGSAINMPRASENLRQGAGLDDKQIRALTQINPRCALGLPADSV